MRKVEVDWVNKEHPVFTTYLNLSSEELKDLKEKILKYREENPESAETNVKAWHSDYKTWHRTRCFADINKTIMNACDEIISSWNNNKEKFKLFDMWEIMYDVGDYTLNHNHHPTHYSCCYYIDVEKDCSPIKFPPDLEIFPENDMLVVFGGDVYHEVPPTRGKRMLIALNLDYPRVTRPSNAPKSFSYQ
jgi:hypothetical protein